MRAVSDFLTAREDVRTVTVLAAPSTGLVTISCAPPRFGRKIESKPAPATTAMLSVLTARDWWRYPYNSSIEGTRRWKQLPAERSAVKAGSGGLGLWGAGPAAENTVADAKLEAAAAAGVAVRAAAETEAAAVYPRGNG
jgi:hypothetical protein